MKTKRDIGGLLYLIGKAGDKGFQYRIRLQKMVLLGKIEAKYPFSFDYSSHYYGPYSANLQDTISQLVSDGLIEEKIIPTGLNSTGFLYRLAPRGQSVLSSINLGIKERGALDHLWESYSGVSTEKLVHEAKAKSGIPSKNGGWRFSR